MSWKMPMRLETLSWRSLPEPSLVGSSKSALLMTPWRSFASASLRIATLTFSPTSDLPLSVTRWSNEPSSGTSMRAYGSALALSETYFTKSSVRT